MVLGAGFEPTKAMPPDLQSGAVDHFAIPAYGAVDGARIRDLALTKGVLYQLSYNGM